MLQSRRTLYVGGLTDQVGDATLRAAFIPFGPLKSIDIVSNSIYIVLCMVLTSVFRTLVYTY